MTATTDNSTVPFLDRIWLQFALTTGLTLLWLAWIGFEILIKGAPQ